MSKVSQKDEVSAYKISEEAVDEIQTNGLRDIPGGQLANTWQLLQTTSLPSASINQTSIHMKLSTVFLITIKLFNLFPLSPVAQKKKPKQET